MSVVTDADLLAALVERIVETIRADKVVLFGSHARGQAQPRSDIDLLVIAPSGEPRYRRSVPLYKTLADVPVEVDIVVYTPEEVEEWSAVPQAFVTTVLRKGRVLYERQS